MKLTEKNMRNVTLSLPWLKSRPGQASLWGRLATVNNLLQLVGIVGGLGGNYLINNGQIYGFLLWIASNIALVALQARTRLYGLVLLHTVFLYLAFQGIARWSERSPDALPHWLVAISRFIA
jgi:nicotinamide riboside transporter PnuC